MSLAFGIAALWFAHVPLAQTCDATGVGSVTFDARVPVPAAGVAERRLTLPADREILILAIESDVDVTLTVSNGVETRVSDSPLARFGAQRVMFQPRSAEAIVKIASREDASVSGGIRLRVMTLSPDVRSGSCATVYRRLAEADALFARGRQMQGTDKSTAADTLAVFRRSGEAYQEALRRRDSGSVPLLAPQIQLALSELMYWQMEDWESAQVWAAQAVQGFAEAGDAYGAARSRVAEAAALTEMPGSEGAPRSKGVRIPVNYLRAAVLLQEAIGSHEARSERYEQAVAVNYLGVLRYYSFEFTAASRLYGEALELYRSVGNRSKQVQVAGNLALLEHRLGNTTKANRLFAQIRPLLDAARDPLMYATVLNNNALCLLDIGEGDLARELYAQALGVGRASHLEIAEAASLQGLGDSYRMLGDLDMAEAFFNQALALRSPERDLRGRIETLWALAGVLRLVGRPDEALRLDQEGLRLAGTAISSKRMRLQVARDYEALGQDGQALAELDAVVSRRTPGDEFVHATALLTRGRIRSAAGSTSAAAIDIKTALEVFRKFDSAPSEFEARVALARAMRDSKDAVTAHREVDAALELAERVRLQSFSPSLRGMQQQSLRPAFDLKISLLQDEYLAASRVADRTRLARQALQVAEQARARSMQDYMAIDNPDSREARVLHEQRRELFLQLAGYQQRYERDLARYRANDPAFAEMRLRMAEIRQQIDRIEARVAETSSMSGTGPSTAYSTPSATGLIEYWLGEEQAYAWVLTANSLTMTPLGATAEINRAARAAHDALRDHLSTSLEERVERLHALGALIWEPVRDLAVGCRTLVFVPDMMLHYVPFAALPLAEGSDQFLVEAHDVATAPSMSILQRGSPSATVRPDRMLLVADPVYRADDTRLAAANMGRRPGAVADMDSPMRRGPERLPGTAREAEAIAALFETDRTDRLQGIHATREAFLSSPLDRYRYVHVASHAVSDARFPQLSALLLSAVGSDGLPVNGRVLAADLLEERFNADVVVLSACDTALGRMVSGEGIVGLRYLVLARGARSVSASLWPVSDRVAMELMTAFYAPLLRDGVSPVAAAGDAMRSVLRDRRADPALWAVFELTVRDGSLIN